jgi:hypothetical protein
LAAEKHGKVKKMLKATNVELKVKRLSHWKGLEGVSCRSGSPGWRHCP